MHFHLKIYLCLVNELDPLIEVTSSQVLVGMYTFPLIFTQTPLLMLQ